MVALVAQMISYFLWWRACWYKWVSFRSVFAVFMCWGFFLGVGFVFLCFCLLCFLRVVAVGCDMACWIDLFGVIGLSYQDSQARNMESNIITCKKTVLNLICLTHCCIYIYINIIFHQRKIWETLRLFYALSDIAEWILIKEKIQERYCIL